MSRTFHITCSRTLPQLKRQLTSRGLEYEQRDDVIIVPEVELDVGITAQVIFESDDHGRYVVTLDTEDPPTAIELDRLRQITAFVERLGKVEVISITTEQANEQIRRLLEH